MRARVEAFDWSRTPLGPRASWPQSLRTTVDICLDTRFPTNLWWGDELVQIYNDGYRDILGGKHPRSLGQSGRECWAEIWPVVGPLCDRVRATGEATWSTDLLLMMERFGFPEETYFTFSYSPVRDESGGVGGVLITVQETTTHVVDQRRLLALRDLGALAGRTVMVAEALADLARALGEHGEDLPFVGIYALEEDGAARVAVAGYPGDALPLRVSTTDPDAPLPFAEALATGAPVGRPLSDGPPCRTGAPVTRAVVLPVTFPERAGGFVVVGVNPHRPLDAAYRDFLGLVAGQIASNLAAAHAWAAERRRAETLAELDRAKTDFFSNVSHEFRTPLTLLLGPLEEALADAVPLPSHQRERVEIAHRNSLRLLRLVNTLLDYSRLEAGRADAVFAPTDLGPVTADHAAAFRSAVERAGLTLDVSCPSTPPVNVDADLWEKLVLNLVSNALKFTFTGGIRVSLAEEDGGVVLCVADTGVGIPAEELPDLFTRFHRVRGQRARTHEGSGIGLALVQEIVRLHGGTIEVASTVGAGTTFTVRLPRAGARDTAAEDRAAPPTALGPRPYVEEALRWLPSATDVSTGARQRILLVEDNTDMRAYLTRILSARWDVTAAAEGAEALDAALASPPSLVVSDVMMPGLDGHAFTRALRADPRTATVPVLLLSARAGEAARVEGLDAGADDYLEKPFTARELVARVEARLAQVRVQELAKETERLLRLRVERERALLAEVFESAPAMMALVRGPDHVFDMVNEEYLRSIAFVSPAQLLGRRVVDALPEAREQGFVELLDAVYRTGIPVARREAELRLPSGVRYFTFRYQRFHDPDGGGVLVHAIDVTESVEARRRAEESERQLRLVVDAVPAIIAYLDRDLRYRFRNATNLDWYEGAPGSPVGLPIEAFTGGGVAERVRPLVARALAGEAVRAELELQTTRGTRTVSVAFTPDWVGDAVVGCVAFVTDITDQRAAERRYREAARMEAVGTLAGGVAHEVNNMMTAIIGLGQLAARRLPAEDRTRRTLTDIVQAATRASGISRQLLAYSRRQHLEPAVFDAREALGDLRALLERVVGEDVVVDLALGEHPAGVSADRGQLEQAVVNLVCNARDAMPRGGRVSVTLDVVDAAVTPADAPVLAPNVRIVIADTGAGMDEATRARAFEPFFTTKPIGKGTGLGLSTVYGMVTQSGGAVHLDSAPGRGTRVTLWLPYVDLDPTVEEPTPVLPTGTETVLLVEDEPLVQESVAASLEDVGFRVHRADDGRAALDLVDGGLTVDLVLSDVRMPRLGGLELLDGLRARGVRTPVMLMSGNPLRVADADCVVLAKPFSTEELVDEVRSFLDRDRD